jgi:hypothetical protein
VVRVRICSCPKRDMNQEQEQIDAVNSNTTVRVKKRKISDTGAARIKTEAFPTFGPMTPYSPYPVNGDVMLQSRYEPLNYMEVSIRIFILFLLPCTT